ncbi:fructose 1,6-bisphosphatase [Cellulophaga baltica]|uniref:fructose 1,6-bisphosphatase n=1 Tax=Cellulophaga TaxID=104264 RepID=UPI001C069F8F|nr:MULTISPECIES: fructose 1,6-bisphosphatase [Cellulophaga]MBU2995823.1 fructose 1,6-bisphosphatase [Cellulophaga baltica]MDO6767218.1 fructose 1,6-bisphosphatase [Cellulophaga sp. 1_MG-2023]
MSTNNKSVIDLNGNKDEQNGSKIDLIKNIIFGEDIKAYNSEFELLKADILEKKKILHELIEEVKTDLNTAIDSVSTDVNIRITALEEKLEDRIEQIDDEKLDKNMLGNLLIELGEKVTKK